MQCKSYVIAIVLNYRVSTSSVTYTHFLFGALARSRFLCSCYRRFGELSAAIHDGGFGLYRGSAGARCGGAT